MLATIKIPAFNLVNVALEEANAESGAAELHGILCGVICAGQRMNGKSWIEPVLASVGQNKPLTRENKTLLLDLYDSSCKQLQEFSFDFQVLLPEDTVSLKSRAIALSQWCAGFLNGLGIAGVRFDNGQLKECQEALEDFVEIAKLDYESIVANDDDEESYMQVVEYVRMAVLLVYTILTAKYNKAKVSGEQCYLH